MPDNPIKPEDDEPWEFVIEGQLDPTNEWHADGGWIMLEDIDTPEQVEELKQFAIARARERQVTIRAMKKPD